MAQVSCPISLHSLLPAEHILLLAGDENKKRTFEQAALLLENLSGGELKQNELFRQFMQRERLGSTSIGYYGAIPHIHVEDLKKKKEMCVLVRLKKPIQYDADNAPTSAVHTLFFVVAPAEKPKHHLKLLATFSHILADEQLMQHLTQCKTPEAVYKRLTAWERENLAALNDIWAQE